MRPGPIVIGALLSVGGAVIASLPFLATGFADTETVGGQIVLIAIGFGAQFLAGYVGARLAGTAHALNGGLTALTAYLVVGIIALASPDEPSVVTLASGAVIALVLGTAAGVLAAARTA